MGVEEQIFELHRGFLPILPFMMLLLDLVVTFDSAFEQVHLIHCTRKVSLNLFLFTQTG
jgi:hypothetical protein